MSTENLITCPKCHHKFVATEAVADAIRKELTEEFQTRSAEREAELGAQLKREREAIRVKALEDGHAQASAELEDARERLKENRDKLLKAQQAEIDLRRKARELEDAKAEFELT